VGPEPERPKHDRRYCDGEQDRAKADLTCPNGGRSIRGGQSDAGPFPALAPMLAASAKAEPLAHMRRDLERYPRHLRGDSSIDALQRRQYDRMVASLQRKLRLLRIVAVVVGLIVLRGVAIQGGVTLWDGLVLTFTLVAFAFSYWLLRDLNRNRKR
jgi:hypothetical protein